MSQSFLHTDTLCVGYGKTCLVQNINITLAPGKILSLIGPNGAGKSTILKTMIRQLQPLGGTILLCGHRLEQVEEKELSRTMSILMTQKVMTERMSCHDVVAAGRYPYTGRFGILGDQDEKQVRSAMELMHVENLENEDFSHISDGQRQRVMLARAICQEPELLILDEPTSYLDIRYKLEFLQVIRYLAKERRIAVLMSMHELELARACSDELICVHNGRIERYGTPQEVLTQEYLCHLYETEEHPFKEIYGNLVFPARFEHYRLAGSRQLRLGYTTGTCAALAVQGALRLLLTGQAPETVSLRTPAGLEVETEPAECRRLSGQKAYCSVRKDAGDDPDVTDGIIVAAEVEVTPETDRARTGNRETRSGVETEGCEKTGLPGAETEGREKTGLSGAKTEGREKTGLSGAETEWREGLQPFYIVIKGGEGIGRVTRPGLDQPPGAAAINSVPRKMIQEQASAIAQETGFRGEIHILLSIPGGKELAQKTFNPQLGVEGGLSILGSTGIIEPMSEQALIQTIELELRQAKEEGHRKVILTPGNYGETFIRESGINPEGIPVIKCSNYIGETLDLAGAIGLEEVLLVGHIGKLVKIAAGVMNTHSRYADCRMEVFAAHAALCGASQELVRELMEAATADACLELLHRESGNRKTSSSQPKSSFYDCVLESILLAIQNKLELRVKGAYQIGTVVFSNTYGLLGETGPAASA